MINYKLIFIITILFLTNIGVINALVIGNSSGANNITLISPVNNEGYYRLKVNFNLQSNQILKEVRYANLDKNTTRCDDSMKFENTCWQILCKNCYGYGNDRERKLSMQEGINRLVIRIIDKNNKVYYQNVSIFVESIKPKVFSIYPRKNEFINGSYFNILYSEKNLKDLTLVYGNDNRIKNMSKNCTSGKKQNCNFSLNLTEYENEPIYYYFIIKDLINTETTQMTRLFVDTITPIITINSPLEGKNYFKKAPLNISLSENAKIEYKDTSDNPPNWKRLCDDCNSFGFDKLTQKIFSKGNHLVQIRATDKAGNFNTKVVNFVMD